jgi:hypothetical protein
VANVLFIILLASVSSKWWKERLYRWMDLWSPVEVGKDDVLEITRGGAWDGFVASTG